MTLRIQYLSERFPVSALSNGYGELSLSWDDLLWAALTIGRPNRSYVFRHGRASYYEAIFRWSLVRMALEQSGPAGYRLYRTNAFTTLDPTEKGAVNYFLGMTMCKLFATELLDTPWLLHLDVFRPMVNAVLTGRSRPDLIGKHRNQEVWHAFEAKGRASNPDLTTKAKAKDQADRLISVNGTNCALHIGAFSYFRDGILEFYWRDPEPQRLKPINVELNERAWQIYYSPIADLLRNLAPSGIFAQDNNLVSIDEADLKMSVHPKVAGLILSSNWLSAHELASSLSEEFRETGYKPDGIRITAGDSWKRRFDDAGSEG